MNEYFWWRSLNKINNMTNVLDCETGILKFMELAFVQFLFYFVCSAYLSKATISCEKLFTCSHQS